MGRDYYFVEVESNPQHDPSKICINLNYEPDDAEKDKIERQCFPGCLPYEISDEQRNQMCHACTWFLDPCLAYLSVDEDADKYRNSIVKSTYHVRHCYDKSPSNYFFKNILHCGLLDDTFLHDGGCVSKLDINHVEYSEERLEDMGEPKRERDKAASAETKQILAYLRECCQKPNTNVYFFDEL